MKQSLTIATAVAALLCGTAAIAQTSVATNGDGVNTQTTVAATVPTTKTVDQTGNSTTETVTTAPITTDGAVKTATTVRAADGQDLVQTTVNADGTATTHVASDVPVARSVRYEGGKKIEKTKTKVVTAAPVNVVTTSNTTEGDAVAVSTTATPNGDAAMAAPAMATTTTTTTGGSITTTGGSMPMQTADSAPMATGASTASLASFDTNNDGALTPLEFGQMVMASQAPASGGAVTRERYSKKSNNAATDVLNQTAAAFGKADTNRDFRVSADELAAWQSMGSPM